MSLIDLFRSFERRNSLLNIFASAAFGVKNQKKGIICLFALKQLFFLSVLLTICGCKRTTNNDIVPNRNREGGVRKEKYFKDNPHNFMLNVIDNKTDIYKAIQHNWFTSFKQDEGVKYSIFITDEYFTLKKDSFEIKIVNACLFVIDTENDYFMGSKDYLCYRTGKKWVVKWVEELSDDNMKKINSIVGDSIHNILKLELEKTKGQNFRFFKTAKGDNSKEIKAIRINQEAIDVFCGKKEGNILDYVSGKVKSQLNEHNGIKDDEMQLIAKNIVKTTNNNEDVLSTTYSCKLLLAKKETEYYGCKQVMAISDTGSRFYTIVTEKFVVVISPKRNYIIASDQTELLDEELTYEEKQKIKQF